VPWSIAPARMEDAAAVLKLLTRSGLPTEGLGRHWGTTLVASADGRVVGCSALEVYSDGVLLRSVSVDTESRQAGLGRQLTEAAIDLAQRLHAPAIYLLTTTAEAYFPRFGFDRISREDVPASVRTSVEFTSVCPSSATVMRKLL
jgi:amino-acid N-acetyltransferase